MATDQMTVTFTCSKCGPTVLELPDDHTDDSIERCKSCKAEVGRYGDIKAKARQAGTDKLKGVVRDAFKGTGWKLK